MAQASSKVKGVEKLLLSTLQIFKRLLRLALWKNLANSIETLDLTLDFS